VGYFDSVLFFFVTIAVILEWPKNSKHAINWW